MLAAQGVVSAEDAAAIRDGLDAIAADYARDGVPEAPTLEDIHMVTESRLAAKIGAAGGPLHTGSSRNDQVAADLQLSPTSPIDGRCRDLGQTPEAWRAQEQRVERTRVGIA